MSNEVLSPHYEHLAIKPWDYAEANKLGFTIGCIIKYLSRYRSPERPPDERMRDLLKAQACVDALIEREKAEKENRRSHGRIDQQAD
jgi:hypothetical protein